MIILRISPGYYTAAFLLIIAVWGVTKRWTFGMLLGYVFFVFAVTVLSRPVGVRNYQLLPFWSYSDPKLREEIILNIILFLPVGALGAKDMGWKIIPVAAMFSSIIELLQLITCRGLMEFDDIIHNTLGAMVGFGLYVMCRIVWKTWHDLFIKS